MAAIAVKCRSAYDQFFQGVDSVTLRLSFIQPHEDKPLLETVRLQPLEATDSLTLWFVSFGTQHFVCHCKADKECLLRRTLLLLQPLQDRLPD